MYKDPAGRSSAPVAGTLRHEAVPEARVELQGGGVAVVRLLPSTGLERLVPTFLGCIDMTVRSEQWYALKASILRSLAVPSEEGSHHYNLNRYVHLPLACHKAPFERS